MSEERSLLSPDYRDANEAFVSRYVQTASPEELQRYLFAIANNRTDDDSIYARDQMRTNVLSYIIMQRHLSDLNAQNIRTQRWFMALAVASMVAAIIQIFAS